ncbi:MAG: M20/M25/M40 family metallo-hydrolase, partial [Bacteroidota bacterium]
MKRISFISLAIVAILLSSMFIGSTLFHRDTPHQKIGKETEEIFDKLVEIRRDLSQYPELAGNEKRTAKVIAEHLSSFGLEVRTGVAGYGVVGILKGGKEGKNIAWRADMDAIPNRFAEKVFGAKKMAIHHACGHDVHMAIGLGIAEVLSKNKASIKGSIYFVFQPEEETFMGAKNMVSSQLFSELEIDEIYALHVTNFPLGQIIVKPNEMYAYQKIIQIAYNDGLSKDDLRALYDKIRNKIVRRADSANPWEVQKAFDPSIGISNPQSNFSDYRFLTENFYVEEDNNQLKLMAELYETEKSNLPKILAEIEQIVKRSEFKRDFIDISYIQENPTVMNDPELTPKAMEILNNIYGAETVKESYGQIPYFNDDFIYFQQKVPGVYFLFGASNSEKGIVAMNHAPNFNVDEDCIKIGVKTFASLILE